MTTIVPKQPIQWQEFQALYEKCTPDEREILKAEIAKMMDTRRQTFLAFLKANPKYLVNLPLSKLREVTDMGLEDAHTWILENAPQTIDILYALEALTIFSMSTDEPTAADLRDVITSLEAVYKATDGKLAANLSTSNLGTLPGSKEESTPAYANKFPQAKDRQSLHSDTRYPEDPRRKPGLRMQGDHKKLLSSEMKGRQA